MEVLTAAVSEADQRGVAGGMQAAGLGPGDRVAMLTRSSGLMLSAILGALRVGIVPVVVNSGLTEAERDALVADADPQMVVDDARLADLVAGPPADLAPWPRARPMHYTSGTTGTPKGVWSGVLEEHEAAGLLAEEREQWGFEAADTLLMCSPLHHSVAIRFGGGTLLAGGTVILPGPFEAPTVAAALSELGPTTAFMVPAHLQRLFAHTDAPGGRGLDPAGLRLMVHAGAPCPPPLKERALAAFGAERVWEFYGSTEGQFTACSGPEWQERPGTVGRARAHRHLEVDPDGTIWCEVPAYARFEYWRDPAKTAAAWRPASGGGAGGPGAFTVGDLGRLDDDGYLYLDGRRDDLIITGGVNVYPAEVEAVLVAAPGVAEVAVFGVDDERWGQRVCAAVVAEDHLEPDDVTAWARTRLAGYKRPKQVFVVDALPHTSTGKLARLQVAAAVGLEPPDGTGGSRPT